MSDCQPKSIPLPQGTIDAVAKAMYELPFPVNDTLRYMVWDQASEASRDWHTQLARAAITAYERSKSCPADAKGEA